MIPSRSLTGMHGGSLGGQVRAVPPKRGTVSQDIEAVGDDSRRDRGEDGGGVQHEVALSLGLRAEAHASWRQGSPLERNISPFDPWTSIDAESLRGFFLQVGFLGKDGAQQSEASLVDAVFGEGTDLLEVVGVIVGGADGGGDGGVSRQWERIIEKRTSHLISCLDDQGSPAVPFDTDLHVVLACSEVLAGSTGKSHDVGDSYLNSRGINAITCKRPARRGVTTDGCCDGGCTVVVNARPRFAPAHPLGLSGVGRDPAAKPRTGFQHVG